MSVSMWLRYFRALIRYYQSILTGPGGTSEYSMFPFDINRPLPDSAEALMDTLCGGLEALDVNYRLTDGTVLGLYREGRFIPHDNDIDIDILDCENPQQIHRMMKRHGMSLGRKVMYGHKVQQLVYYSPDHVIYDMVFWYRDGDSVRNHSEPGYLREQPAQHFENLDVFTWHNRSYPVPAQLEDWLVFRFGPDWRTPKTYKGDWKNECFDLTRLSAGESHE